MANSEYHHGNLKESLIRLGEAELERITRPQMLSLREIAKRAGVSHNAPYRHFQSKEALIEEILERAFNELAEQILSAPLFYPASLLLQMQYVGRLWALLSFRHPQKTLLMFQNYHPQHTHIEANLTQLVNEFTSNQISEEIRSEYLSFLCLATLNGIALIVANDQIRSQKPNSFAPTRFGSNEQVYALTDEAMRLLVPAELSREHR